MEPLEHLAFAGTTRKVLASDDESPGDSSACFGDKSAGCCGAARCERLPEEEGDILAVTKQVGSIAGITHTTFNFSLAGGATVRGGDARQVALLLTLDAMAELSVVRDAAAGGEQTQRLVDTHIGCNPLDGFLAFRQRLDCPACDGEESLGHTMSISVKVWASRSSFMHGSRSSASHLRPANPGTFLAPDHVCGCVSGYGGWYRLVLTSMMVSM